MRLLPGLAGLAALSLAGCVTTPDLGPNPPTQVTFETTPCFGSCPVFSLTVRADGTGVYEGGRFVKVKGRHEFVASPAEVRAFYVRLQPFRPEGTVRYDMANCPGPAHTDSPSVNVRWISATRADALDWYLGCRVDALAEIEPDLQNAWKELPLDDLVGTADNRFEYDQRGS